MEGIDTIGEIEVDAMYSIPSSLLIYKPPNFDRTIITRTSQHTPPLTIFPQTPLQAIHISIPMSMTNSSNRVNLHIITRCLDLPNDDSTICSS